MIYLKMYGQERLRKTKDLKMYGLTWVIQHELNSFSKMRFEIPSYMNESLLPINK
jgi:hypothetical protein